MPAPPAYLDECIDQPLAYALRARGFDVITAREAGNLGQADDSQLAYAASVSRVIVSYNRLHFVRWHTLFEQQGRSHAGILLLLQHPPLSRRIIRAAMLLDWLANQDLRSRVFTWGRLQQALLHGFRLPEDRYTEDEVQHALGRQ